MSHLDSILTDIADIAFRRQIEREQSQPIPFLGSMNLHTWRVDDILGLKQPRCYASLNNNHFAASFIPVSVFALSDALGGMPKMPPAQIGVDINEHGELIGVSPERNAYFDATDEVANKCRRHLEALRNEGCKTAGLYPHQIEMKGDIVQWGLFVPIQRIEHHDDADRLYLQTNVEDQGKLISYLLRQKLISPEKHGPQITEAASARALHLATTTRASSL